MTGSSSSRFSVLARAMTVCVQAYQRWISPAIPARCRYYPSCSSYAVEALGTHGALKGLVLAAWRILRCNPWSRGGVDHVPDRGQWRYHHPHDIPRFELEKG